MCYERDFILYLSANIQDHVIEAFNSTLRYLNDLLNIENLYFEQISVEINNFPFLDGDVQRSPSRLWYIYFAACLFARVCSTVSDYNKINQLFTT